MSVLNNILKVWHYIFGLIVGVTVFYVGTSRVSMGIGYVTDSSTAHFMNVGLLYIKISLLIIIGFTIMITYSLAKHKK